MSNSIVYVTLIWAVTSQHWNWNSVIVAKYREVAFAKSDILKQNSMKCIIIWKAASNIWHSCNVTYLHTFSVFWNYFFKEIYVWCAPLIDHWHGNKFSYLKPQIHTLCMWIDSTKNQNIDQFKKKKQMFVLIFPLNILSYAPLDMYIATLQLPSTWYKMFLSKWNLMDIFSSFRVYFMWFG